VRVPTVSVLPRRRPGFRGTDENPSDAYGQATIDTLASLVYDALGAR
jgi:hypothetical protein